VPYWVSRGPAHEGSRWVARAPKALVQLTGGAGILH